MKEPFYVGPNLDLASSIETEERILEGITELVTVTFKWKPKGLIEALLQQYSDISDALSMDYDCERVFACVEQIMKKPKDHTHEHKQLKELAEALNQRTDDETLCMYYSHAVKYELKRRRFTQKSVAGWHVHNAELEAYELGGSFTLNVPANFVLNVRSIQKSLKEEKKPDVRL